MASNIEPLAREIAALICRRTQTPERAIAAWVDRHWECVAADLEVGLIDEHGVRRDGGDWTKGLEAYR